MKVFSHSKDNRTRRHEVTLLKDKCRLDIKKYSFSQRSVNEFNKLSTDCVTANSVNMFKSKVDTYLRLTHRLKLYTPMDSVSICHLGL